MLKPEAEGEIRRTIVRISLDLPIVIELRRCIKMTFGLMMSVLEIAGSGLLRDLSRSIAMRLVEKLHKCIAIKLAVR